MAYKFSNKQKDVIKKTVRNELGFINILEGSVRSGKTFIVNLAWTLFILNSQHNVFLMSGESTDSLYRNVIGDMILILGRSRAIYQDSAKGGAQLLINYNGKTKICYCRGGSKANDEGKIRGITIGGWMADEITLHHESFVKQALSRMSLEGAKAFWTTNPDSPYHYIKTEYIDKAKEKEYSHWHFSLDDNLVLSEEYKKNIKNAYTGVFYQRFILGLWVLSEGAIYDMWDKQLNTFIDEDLSPGFKSMAQRYISIDYGASNPTVFLDIWDDGDVVWILDEYYYDSKKQGQKENSQYATDLVKFIGSDYPRFVIIDPSARSLKISIKNKGIRTKDADNDVLEGIRMVSTMIANRKLRVNRKRCPNFLQEVAGYVWDEKAALRGEDKPVKDKDHALDAIRYFVKTIIRPRRLAKL